MKHATLFLLLAITLTSGVQAQEMDVIGQDGQTDQYPLAGIDRLTFDLRSAAAGSRGADVLQVHHDAGTDPFAVAGIDSLCFVAGSQMIIYQTSGATSYFDLATVDSLTFVEGAAGTVTIAYDGATVTVDNPLAGSGVVVDVVGADVTITSTATVNDIAYVLSGSTDDGMCKVYSDSNFSFVLDGVQITNLDGPAINNQADEGVQVELVAGTTSILTDGVTYSDPPGDEDQKGAFFSEGQLIFDGGGSLVINGRGDDQHGLASDDYVEVRAGSIAILSATKDGIHTNDGFFQHGGTVTMTSSGDGVDGGDGPVGITDGVLEVDCPDADNDAIKCDGELAISGGEVTLDVGGDQSKGLNAVAVLLTGGVVTINTSGGVVLEASGSGYDPSYCSAIKADDLVLVDGAQVTVTAIGEAGRGVTCDGDVFIRSGSLTVTSSGDGDSYVDETGTTDAYHGPCLKADGDLELTGGSVVLSHSGDGGRGISVDADLTIGAAGSTPLVDITTTGQTIDIGWDDGAEAKAVTVDSLITITSGEITISSADDGIKSKYWIDIDGGLIDIVDSFEGIESPNLFINGGEVHVQATDDGLNATYGVDGEFHDGSNLTIAGGWVDVSASGGDGIDSNGDFFMAGGTLIIHGPPSQPEVGIDINGSFVVSGGYMTVSAINSFMVESPSGQSTQRTVLLRRNQTLNAGTLIHIEDTAGNSILTFAPERRYSHITFSSDELTAGTTYRVYTGGSCTGEEQDGLYSGGVYSGGTLRTTFTSNGTVQTVNF